jgi:UDP-glucose 4-epimerase
MNVFCRRSGFPRHHMIFAFFCEQGKGYSVQEVVADFSKITNHNFKKINSL